MEGEPFANSCACLCPAAIFKHFYSIYTLYNSFLVAKCFLSLYFMLLYVMLYLIVVLLIVLYIILVCCVVLNCYSLFVAICIRHVYVSCVVPLCVNVPCIVSPPEWKNGLYRILEVKLKINQSLLL